MTNCIDKLQSSLSAYHEAEQDMITTNDRSYYAGRDDDSDSYIWLRDPLSDVHLETLAGGCLSNPESYPNDCLAGILREVLGTIIPTGIDLQGLGIERIGNQLRFCISGSTSVEVIQKTLAQNHTPHDRVGEK